MTFEQWQVETLARKFRSYVSMAHYSQREDWDEQSYIKIARDVLIEIQVLTAGCDYCGSLPSYDVKALEKRERDNFERIKASMELIADLEEK